jgi:hypothetical protein
MTTFWKSFKQGLITLWPWGYMALAGVVIHVGTAILRFNTFIPTPKLLDFSAFYVAAYALRQKENAYQLPQEFVQTIRAQTEIGLNPPPIFNPPFWPIVLQPLTYTNFPQAAWVWLGIMLLLLLLSTFFLAKLSTISRWFHKIILFVVIVTFGPVFLDLTLGQTSVLLLTAVLIIGYFLTASHLFGQLVAGITLGISAGVKLFPVLWLLPIMMLNRWQIALLGIGFILLAFLGPLLISPNANQAYWADELPSRLTAASTQPSFDDQSLTAWIDRVGREHTYTLPGLNVNNRNEISWQFPWSINPTVLKLLSYLLAGLILLGIFWLWYQERPLSPQGFFYLWITFLLLILPHMARYNHALLLPGMAWLWGQNKNGKIIAIIVYFLTGLSRLNHLWASILPIPLVPVATGFGLFAVLLLLTGLIWHLWPNRLPMIS